MLPSVLRILGSVWLAVAVASPALAQIELPTPRSHYEDYDPEQAAQQLLLQLAVKIPAESRERALELLQRAKRGGSIDLTVAEATRLLESAGWEEWRPELLRLLLHRSNVLDIAPEAAQEFMPLIHDSLLFFLAHMSESRLIERIVAQANLPADAERGDRVLAFITNTPSLQKLAQILARNPSIDPDLRAALQTVENGLATAQYDEIRAQLDDETSDALREEFRLEPSDRLLAEASVGAIIEVDFTRPGSSTRERAACKVLKPYAVAAMKEDLEIVDDLLEYLEQEADFYHLGSTPLVDIFQELRRALAREVRIEDERSNLVRAREYYQDDPNVLVPELYPFSTPNVTCMEFVDGVKITDAFLGDPEDRAVLARRLSDTMTYDVLFSPQETALFHGDPHAGNVFHVVHDAAEPYRIALLDWGLAAEFSRREREQMVQLLLGLKLKNSKRLANNVDVLVEWDPQSPEEREQMRLMIEDMLAEQADVAMFKLLDELIVRLAREGHSVRFTTTMFIKSQLTIAGILTELDPSFEQDDYVMSRVSGQVTRELGTRLLRTIYFPAWNSHDYKSMMSNEDVKDVQFQKIGGAFKKLGKGIWHGITFQWLF
jgi:ubiquinone biosynthesis protein